MNYSLEDGRMSYDSTMLELPHALADWGKIPLNPAIVAGWRFRTDQDDSYLFRLLLAEQFRERFHFGANLGFERQVAGELETEYELNAALSYSLIDNKLAVGAQFIVEYETARGGESDDEVGFSEAESEHATTILLGPSLLYRPTRNLYIGLIPLFGLNKDSPAVEAFFLVGIDFEPFSRGYSREEKSEGEFPFQPVRRPR
jgi:hypothetical protein